MALAGLLLAGGATGGLLLLPSTGPPSGDGKSPQGRERTANVRLMTDAIMRAPGNANHYWRFSGNRYTAWAAGGEKRQGAVVNGPAPLSDWSFGDLPEFRDGIDAVMRTPDTESRQYWVFSGSQYVRIKLDNDDRIRFGPTPLNAWSKSFGDLPGFRDGIDAVMQTPYDRSEYWVFSEDQYVRIKVGNNDADRLLSGPHNTSDWFDSVKL